MTWTGTTVDGVIVCTNDDRLLEAITNEPHATNIAGLIAQVLNALDRADGDPRLVASDTRCPAGGWHDWTHLEETGTGRVAIGCDNCGAEP